MSMLDKEQLIKINVYLSKIVDSLEKHNELKQKELELKQYEINFEVEKYKNSLNNRKIEKMFNEKELI